MASALLLAVVGVRSPARAVPGPAAKAEEPVSRDDGAQEDIGSGPAVGAQAPPIVLRGLDDRYFRSSQVVGSKTREPAAALVVNFFATWCEPCLNEMPAIGRIAREFAPRGVRLLLVDVGEKREQVESWLPGKPAGVTVLLDPHGVAAKSYGADRNIPRTFVIDASGEVTLRLVGASDDFEEILTRHLRLVAPFPAPTR